MTNKPLFITSGEFRGRKLSSPQTITTHPMGSRERLALMNMVSSELENATVLDLFAGTGAIGLEALSRKAKSVDFVEDNQSAIFALKQNIEQLNLSDRTQVFKRSVFDFQPQKTYDIVFADPPYDLFSNKKVSKEIRSITNYEKSPKTPININSDLVKILNLHIRTAGKLFILSHPDYFDPNLLEGKLISTRKFAGAKISVFAK